MKALLKKDYYSFLSQFKSISVALFIFSIIPDGRFLPFASFYSVLMISLALMSLEETTHWDRLALMLPYSRLALVLDKYVVGWICLFISTALSVVCQALYSVLWDYEFGREYVLNALFCVGMGLTVQAVMSPINFRLGTTKGRMVNLLIVCVLGAILGSTLVLDEGAGLMGLISRVGSSMTVAILFPVLGALLCAASVPLSAAGYRKRLEM